PLPALREFLAGERSAKRGRLDAAATHYQAALTYDSTLAYAALGLVHVASADPAGSTGLLPRALALAWAARDRLARDDAAYLRAVVGPRYPRPSSIATFLSAWQAATASAPERSQTWFGLADVIYHGGYVLGLPHPMASARVAFEHALEANRTD